MPLLTENIDEARLLFTNVEARAQSAELRAALLQDTVDKMRSQISINAVLAQTLTQRTMDQEAANAQLRIEQVTQISPDTPLGSFVSIIGMAVALGEATMPDRAIPSVGTTVTAYHTPDGGLRFYQPEFGDSSGAGSTTFTMVKTPSTSGAPAPRNLYVVLEYMQSVFDDPFWSKFVTQATPPVQPAQQVVVEVSKTLANTGGWNFPFLVQEAAAIASSANALGKLLTDSVQVRAFNSSILAVSNLAQAFDPSVKPLAVVGDLLALTAALDTMARIADSVRAL